MLGALNMAHHNCVVNLTFGKQCNWGFKDQTTTLSYSLNLSWHGRTLIYYAPNYIIKEGNSFFCTLLSAWWIYSLRVNMISLFPSCVGESRCVWVSISGCLGYSLSTQDKHVHSHHQCVISPNKDNLGFLLLKSIKTLLIDFSSTKLFNSFCKAATDLF